MRDSRKRQDVEETAGISGRTVVNYTAEKLCFEEGGRGGKKTGLFEKN